MCISRLSNAYPVFKGMIHEPGIRPTYCSRKWSYQDTPAYFGTIDPRLVWTIADEKSKRRNWHLCSDSFLAAASLHPESGSLSSRCIRWFPHNLGEVESAGAFSILVLSILFDPAQTLSYNMTWMEGV